MMISGTVSGQLCVWALSQCDWDGEAFTRLTHRPGQPDGRGGAGGEACRSEVQRQPPFRRGRLGRPERAARVRRVAPLHPPATVVGGGEQRGWIDPAVGWRSGLGQGSPPEWVCPGGSRWRARQLRPTARLLGSCQPPDVVTGWAPRRLPCGVTLPDTPSGRGRGRETGESRLRPEVTLLLRGVTGSSSREGGGGGVGGWRRAARAPGGRACLRRCEGLCPHSGLAAPRACPEEGQLQAC